MNFKNRYVGISLFLFCFGLNAQSEWDFGAGASFIQFSDSPEEFPMEDLNVQIPNLSITRNFYNGFSAGVGVGFTAVKSILVIPIFINESDLLFFDVYGRYNFNQSHKDFVPYVLAGGSIMVRDWEGTKPSINAGAGATYWVFPRIGLNTQVVFKYVSESASPTFVSHTQFSVSAIFALSQRAKRRGFRRLDRGF